MIILTVVLCGQLAQAQTKDILRDWVPGRFYYLSPGVARNLGFDYGQLAEMEAAVWNDTTSNGLAPTGLPFPTVST